MTLDVVLRVKEKSDTKGRSRLNNTTCQDPLTTRTSDKKEESHSRTNGSPIPNGSPMLPTSSPTFSPTTKTNVLLIGLAMANVIGYILCGIIFCECVFYHLVENVIIDNLKNRFESEYAELLNGLYRPTPEPTDTPPPTTIDLINSGARLPENLDSKCIFDVECNVTNENIIFEKWK